MGNLFTFTFPTRPGHNYLVHRSPTLIAPMWQTVTNIAGAGTPALVTDTMESVGEYFYRVQEE